MMLWQSMGHVLMIMSAKKQPDSLMARFIIADKIVKRKLRGISFSQLVKQLNIYKDIRIG